MSNESERSIILSVEKDGWTGGIQISISDVDINGSGGGYRIAGPKYNGSSTTLKEVKLDYDTAQQIRKYLDKVRPPETLPNADATQRADNPAVKPNSGDKTE